jgi:hypothetical protein
MLSNVMPDLDLRPKQTIVPQRLGAASGVVSHD